MSRDSSGLGAERVDLPLPDLAQLLPGRQFDELDYASEPGLVVGPFGRVQCSGLEVDWRLVTRCDEGEVTGGR